MINKYKRNKFLVYSAFTILLGLGLSFYIAKKSNSSLADSSVTPISTGDVPFSDADKINKAIDNFVSTQKFAQEEYKKLEIKVNEAKQNIDNTIVEITTKAGKDWRSETIAEKDPNLRTYKFIKREQPITAMPTPVEAKEEKK